MFSPSLGRAFGLVLLGLLLGTGGIASATQSTDPTPVSEPAATSEGSSGGWGPIVGACFGVLFGGVLAVWQIRAMKNRG